LRKKSALHDTHRIAQRQYRADIAYKITRKFPLGNESEFFLLILR